MNAVNILVCAIVFVILVSVGYGTSLKYNKETADDYMNVCLKGSLTHKEKPGPESDLFAQCMPWQSRSCCTKETAERINLEKNFLNFNWDHCKDLSQQCRQYFIQDLCFYECSPNVGPWLVEDKRKIRKQRFMDVPLCQSDCLQWWDACKDDFTCVENWAEHFNWSTGINTCPEGSNCRQFHEVYSGPEHFCENVFGPSFKVVPDSPGDCFYMWFDPKDPNPNEIVARKKVASLIGENDSSCLRASTWLPFFMSLFLFVTLSCLKILS